MRERRLKTLGISFGWYQGARKDNAVFLLPCMIPSFPSLSFLRLAVRLARGIAHLKFHFTINATVIAQRLHIFFPWWKKLQQRDEFLLGREPCAQREKRTRGKDGEVKGRYTNSKYRVAFNSTSPSFRPILRSGGAGAFILLSDEREALSVRPAGNRCFQFRR